MDSRDTDAGPYWGNSTALEPGHIVGIARKRCSSAVCRSVGHVNHLAHSPCQIKDCLNYQGTWHGSTHLVPCTGCDVCR